MMLPTPSGWSALKFQVLHCIKSFRWGWAAAALLLAATLSGRIPHGQTTALPTRGVEEVGRVYLGEALNAYIGHMAMLFVTGKHPTIGNGMMQDTVNWVNDPLHSVIADGYGGLAIYAHPDGADRVLLVDGLVGMELYSQSYPATAYGRDQMWDTVNTTRYNQGKSLLWAFAADDLHSTSPGNFNFAWNTSLVPSVDVFALKTALRTGAFYASAGPVINAISVSGSTITLTLGQSSEVDWLYSGQYDNAGTFSATTAAGANRAIKRDTNVTTSSLNITAAGVPVSSLKFVRAIVKASSKDARTQPFRISSTGVISNPYPATGTWIKGMTHNHDDAPIGDDGTTLSTYRANYVGAGQVAAFETAYSYWEVPYQHLDSDGYPDINSVSPGKVAAAAGSTITITGVNFLDGITAQLGNPQLGNFTLGIASKSGTTVLQASIPTNVPPGVYDVVLTNPDTTRGNLPLSVTVQEATASNAGWASYQAPDLPWNQTTSIAAVGSDIWVGTVKGVSQFKNNAWTPYIPPNCINAWSRSIYSIQPDASGGIWFGSVPLWYRTPTGTWQCQQVGTSEERWGKMAFDSTGRLWVTSRWEEGIAVRSTSGSWSVLTSSLPITDVQAITRDSQGYMWVGFNGGDGIQKSTNGSSWTPVAIPSFGPSHYTNYASVLRTAPNGDVWTAVAPMNTDYDPNYAGVVQYIGGNAQTYNIFKAPQLPHPRVTDILITKSGDVWFSSRSGVARLNTAGQWQTFTSQNSGLVCDIVMAMAEDQSGNIWFATANGVSVLATTTNRAPVVTNPGAQSTAAGNSVSLQIQASDPDGNAIAFGATGLPAGLSINSTGLITGTVSLNAQASNNTVVTATDSLPGGTGSTSFTWSVTGLNTPPAVQNPGPQTTVAGSAASLQIHATDADNDQLTYSASGLPAGLSINSSTGLIAGTVSAAAVSANVAVTVQDGRGGSGAVTFIWTITQPPPPPPAAPGGLVATADSSSQITLTWADNSTNEDGFYVEQSSGGTFVRLATPAAQNATRYTVTGLSAGTAYSYRVQAFNAGGTSQYSSIAGATTLPPPPAPPAAPSNLSALGGSGQVKLTWTDNSTDETKFVIQRTGTGSLSINVVSPAVPNSTGTVSYVDTAVARNTSYKYVVSACNANGCSNASNSSSTKTKPH